MLRRLVAQLGNNETVKVMKSTQYIDGFWCILRKELRNLPKSTTAAVKLAVQAAQWKHWHSGEDLWVEAGAMFERAVV